MGVGVGVRVGVVGVSVGFKVFLGNGIGVVGVILVCLLIDIIIV